MSSPVRTLRSALKTLFTSSVTVTKSSGTPFVPYFEGHPSHRPVFPYIMYSNLFLTPNNAKACLGWNPLLRLEVVTGASPGHNSVDYADEIEEQVIDLVSAKPYTLNLGASYGLVSSNQENSQYIEEFTDLAIGRSKDKRPYHIIRKITDFRLSIQEL